MKRVLFLILLLFLSYLSFAQKSEEIDARIAEVREHIYEEPVLSLNEIQEIIEESNKISYYKGLAEGYNLQGIILVNSGINDLGLQSFITSLDNYMKINDTIGISKSYNNLGVVSYTVKKYYYSIYFFNQSLNIQARNKQYRNIVDLKNNMGSVYEKLGKYNLAMQMHFEAMSIADENNYILGKATSLNNIAVIYENMNNLDSALSYCKKSLLYLDSIPKSQLSITYSNLAGMQINKGEIDEAYKTLELALKSANDVDASTNLPQIYNLFSKYYEAKGNLKMAYEYLKKYKDITEKNEVQTTESDFTDFIISMQQRKWNKDKLMMDKEMRLQSRIQWLIILFIAVVLIVVVLFFINIKNRNRILNQENALIEIEKKRLAEELQSKAIIAAMEQEKLINDIKIKERELTSMTMHIATKNETLQEIEKHINQFTSSNSNISNDASLRKIIGIIKMNASDEAVWKNYFYHFEQVYPGFFKNLTAAHPELTSSEEKLCAYIIINISNKEMAHVMGISEASVKIKKNRLAKKIKIDSASDLSSYLKNFAG